MKSRIILLLIISIISCPKKSNIAQPPIEEQWMGVYLKQQKIGYSFFQLRKVKDEYKLTNRIKISLKMMEQPEEVFSNFSGVVDNNYALKQFEFSFNSKGRLFNARGVVKEGFLFLEINSGSIVKKDHKRVEFPIYPTSLLGTIAIKKKLGVGKEHTIKVFESSALSIADAKITVLDKEKVKIANKNYNLNKMIIDLLGLKTTIWVDDNGIIYKEESPPGIVMIQEKREQALAKEQAMSKLDILSVFSIPVDTTIAFPRKLEYLKVKITNADLTELKIADDFQKIIQYKPLMVEIRTYDSLPTTIELPIKEASEFLKPSLCIQSDDSMIRKTADKIVGKEKNGVSIVHNLLKWVFTNVNKRATASLPSAVDVLQYLEGDCNEHSVLFAALSRAAGIPCQICVGLVYLDGYFYYHAWNKVYLGKWIAVDPTFGQFPADATHIKLSEGELEEQAKILKIVGELKIKIMGFQ